MPKTTIRHATDADFQTLLDIDQASFPDGVAYDAAELSYFMRLPGSDTILIEEEGEVVAFLIMEVDRHQRAAMIVTIDVCGSSRRKGYGSSLLERCEQILVAGGIRTCALQVDTENSGAIQFYKQHGFSVTRRLKHYYPNGHDAWVMIKTLPTAAAR